MHAAVVAILCGCSALSPLQGAPSSARAAGQASASRAVTAPAPGEARVTRVINDVTLASGRSVVASQGIADGATVRTGKSSRAEIRTAIGSTSRLAANTACQFNGAARSVNLLSGAMLFEAPAAALGAKLRVGAITIDLGDATTIVERQGSAYMKLLVLAGTARAYLPAVGESVLVEAGQMLIANPSAKTLPEPVHFDIAQLYQTSLLTNNDFTPLASRTAILAAIQAQRNDPAFSRTNLVIFGRGTRVNFVEPSAPAAESRARAGSTSARTRTSQAKR